MAMRTSHPMADLLCCPTSHEPLRELPASRLAQLNAAIAEGQVQRLDGQPVLRPLQAALISRDDRVIYPIEDGIPVLIHERGIGTTQLS